MGMSLYIYIYIYVWVSMRGHLILFITAYVYIYMHIWCGVRWCDFGVVWRRRACCGLAQGSTPRRWPSTAMAHHWLKGQSRGLQDGLISDYWYNRLFKRRREPGRRRRVLASKSRFYNFFHARACIQIRMLCRYRAPCMVRG